MDLRIDRLTLRVPGLSPDEGRRLAALVGRGLAAIPADVADGDAVRVALDSRPGERVEAMADRIAAELTTSLRRSP
jgi:hypothetical protein